jgi:hypothetical protein
MDEAALSDLGLEHQMVVKTFDSKGRIALGSQFAGQTALVDVRPDGSIVIELARVIPEREAWLYANSAALDRVRHGLREAQEGEFSKSPPDLEADAALVDEIDG